MSELSLSIKRLCPINYWEVDKNGPKWPKESYPESPGEPAFIIDLTTQDRYLNQSKANVRGKCTLAFFGSLLVHPFTMFFNVIWRIIKLISFYEFWKKPDKEKLTLTEYEKQLTINYRKTQYTNDFFRVLASPFSIPLLALSALYGIIRPYDGRKVHGNLEIAFYGKPILAPCFQPNPKNHLFGGDIDDPFAW